MSDPVTFKVGDRVILPMVDSVPEERGTVKFVPDPSDEGADMNMILVEVDEAYRDEDDDGLREVSVTDVKKEEDHDGQDS